MAVGVGWRRHLGVPELGLFYAVSLNIVVGKEGSENQPSSQSWSCLLGDD